MNSQEKDIIFTCPNLCHHCTMFWGDHFVDNTAVVTSLYLFRFCHCLAYCGKVHSMWAVLGSLSTVSCAFTLLFWVIPSPQKLLSPITLTHLSVPSFVPIFSVSFPRLRMPLFFWTYNTYCFTTKKKKKKKKILEAQWNVESNLHIHTVKLLEFPQNSIFHICVSWRITCTSHSPLFPPQVSLHICSTSLSLVGLFSLILCYSNCVAFE